MLWFWNLIMNLWFFFGSSASAWVVRDLEFFAQVVRRQARERFVWKGHETWNDCQVNLTLLHFNKYVYWIDIYSELHLGTSQPNLGMSHPNLGTKWFGDEVTSYPGGQDKFKFVPFLRKENPQVDDNMKPLPQSTFTSFTFVPSLIRCVTNGDCRLANCRLQQLAQTSNQ